MSPQIYRRWTWFLAAAIMAPLLFLIQRGLSNSLIAQPLLSICGGTPYRAIGVGLMVGVVTFPVSMIYLGLSQHYWRDSPSGGVGSSLLSGLFHSFPLRFLLSVFVLNTLLGLIVTNVP